MFLLDMYGSTGNDEACVPSAGVQGWQKPHHAGDRCGSAWSRCVQYGMFQIMSSLLACLALRCPWPHERDFHNPPACALRMRDAVWLAPPPVWRCSVAPCHKCCGWAWCWLANGPSRGRQLQPSLRRAAAPLTARRTVAPRQLSPDPSHGGLGMRVCRASAGACSQAAGPWLSSRRRVEAVACMT